MILDASVSTKQYYIAAGRDLCPDGNEKLASGSVFMGAKHCSSIGGDYLVRDRFAMGSFHKEWFTHTFFCH